MIGPLHECNRDQICIVLFVIDLTWIKQVLKKEEGCQLVFSLKLNI